MAVDRLLASLLPMAGLVAVLTLLRQPWWRGLLAGTTLLVATAGVWLMAAGSTLMLPALAAEVPGTFVVLVGWSALALLELVLDERPRLRLACRHLLTADALGHPLALAAIVPAVGTLGWLGARFLAPEAGGTLPEVPFLDETTLATALVVGFLLLAACVARTGLVRGILNVTAVVLVAALLPIELPLAMAVAGWSAMAVGALVVGRRLGPNGWRTASAVAGGLIMTGSAAVLLSVAPPDRLLLEMTSVPPGSGPPNAATLATLALAVALGAAAWTRRSEPRLGPWLAIAAEGAVAWGLSVGIADVFAMRVAGGSVTLEEAARQAQVALSITWAGLGLATLLVGLVRDLPPARQAGLTLLAIATVKVFVYDLSTLDIAYRVLSLVGLGVLMLVSAWLYLHARHRGGPQAMGR